MKGRLVIPLCLAVAALGSACAGISFGRRVTDDEVILQQEIHSYYNQVQEAFATANPDALVSLFSPSITHPMSHQEIKAWAEKFFKENRNGHFKIEKLSFEGLSYIKASVVLTYKVETPEHKGDFGGTERDTLVKDHGHWYVAGWDKVDPNEKAKIETLLHSPY
ncbi:MAG: nuclear transport factor 2 family protein [Elusimicrobia bacterium]|nr:nuclear transport factor 2 family protein [Elusimicrobiota bacterium]